MSRNKNRDMIRKSYKSRSRNSGRSRERAEPGTGRVTGAAA